MLRKSLDYDGLQNFSRRFSSASYNTSGSIFSILDPSKHYASVGKKMIGFSKPDAISKKERADAHTYGVGLDTYFKTTAKEQIQAPDAVKQPGYTGGGGSSTEYEAGEASGAASAASAASAPSASASASASKAEGEGEAEGAKEPVVEYEDIKESMAVADYDKLPAAEAKSAINRARLLKGDARLEGLEVKVTKTKTKKAIVVLVTAEKKKDLVKTFKAELAELVKAGQTGTNYYTYVQSMSAGSAFKVIGGTPAASRRGSAGGGAPESPKTPSASAASMGGGAGSAATAASKAVTSVLGEEEWTTVGKKKGKK
jgi:hypothetical protein